MSVILIVEDSPLMAAATVATLQAAGHTAFSCSSEAEALILCQERKPDILITEYYLAESTSLGLLEKLSRRRSSPIVIMATALGNEQLAVETLKLNAWTYHLKTENYLTDLPELVASVGVQKAEAQAKEEKEMLHRRLEAQNELAGWLSHNFKNILAASIGYLNLINFDNPEQSVEKRAEYVKESKQSQESALELLDQIARLTDSEGGISEPILVSEVLDEAWQAARSKVLEIASANFAPERVEALQAQLSRVIFLNNARTLEPQILVRADLHTILEGLLQNAIEAVLNKEEEPRILAQGILKGNFLEITIKDNGRGMSPKVLQHALEPFFSTKGEVGVGLGLSLASSLALRNGGVLELKSTQGAGSSVKVTLALGA